MLQAGANIEGRYTLLRELGSGGMGAVWLARHQRLDALFAIKFLQYAGANSSVKPRFYREARLAARLRGPHVPQIFDLGEWQGIPYILMEYLQGEDLRRRLDRRQFLSPTETLRLLTPVARVLLRAHAMGIVHRDLKPENIFLCAHDGEEVVKVLDFGVAKVLTSGELASVVTRTNASLGTPYYMSPEQLRNSKDVDHRADLWALALLAFEMLTGRRAFAADNISQLVLLIETGDPPDPCQLRPELPPALLGWWRRAAARQPVERHQDAAALLDELARALALPEPALEGVVLPSQEGEPHASESFLPTEHAAVETTPSEGDGSLELPAMPARSVASLATPAAAPGPVAPRHRGAEALLALGLLAGAFWLGQRSHQTSPHPSATSPLPASTSSALPVAPAPLVASPSLAASPAESPLATPSGGPLPGPPVSLKPGVTSSNATPRPRPPASTSRPGATTDTIGF
jgi:serine/threonine-protein kinase